MAQPTRKGEALAKQASVEARVKKIIEVDGLKFKDLNGNGVPDPYEDWRLTPEERADDLVSRIIPDEKIDKEKPMGGRPNDDVDTEGNKYRPGVGLHY